MKLWNEHNESENHGWSIPDWNWREELVEAVKCLVISMVVVAVLAFPAKYAFNAYFGNELPAGKSSPASSSAYSGNADIGGGANVFSECVGEPSPMNPSVDPVNTPQPVRYSEQLSYDDEFLTGNEDGSGPKDDEFMTGNEDGSGPKDPSNMVININDEPVDNGVAPDLEPIEPTKTDYNPVTSGVTATGFDG